MNKLTPAEIVLMKKAGEMTKNVLLYAETLVKEGVSTLHVDKLIEKYIRDGGGVPAFLGYDGFPGAACISVNEMVVHGIPSNEVILKEGDIVSIDTGVIYKGYYSDAARTFPVGKISAEKQKLIDVTKQCFFEGVNAIKVGERLGRIGNAIQSYAEKNGCSVVRELVGHGISKNLHESPNVPNYGKPTDGPKITENSCIAIEPMINLGRKEIAMISDGWGIVTRDGKPSAHYENTILITENGVEILTL